MSLEDWKNNEISQLLSEAWGFKFNTLQEFDEFNGNGEITEQEEEIDEAAEGSRQGGSRAKQQCEKQGKKMVAGKCVEVQEEGGTAKRSENKPKGAERGMNLADRVHEGEEDEAEELEEQCPAEEEEEVVEEETTSRMAGLRKTRGEVEPEEEEETDELKEAIKTLLGKYLKG